MPIDLTVMSNDLALLVLRLVTGLIVTGHGLQKLAGWFGGRGLEGTGRWLESIGLRPGRFWAVVSGLAETAGGLALALGFYTGVAALLIITVMLAAILMVHAPKGFWNTEGGYEYPLVLIAVALALGLTGPGAWALDTRYGLPALAPGQYGVGLLVALLLAGLISLWSRTQVARTQA